ncbi:hypothetical protein ABTM23_19310, partial [Acinetobacter baumannii]
MMMARLGIGLLWVYRLPQHKDAHALLGQSQLWQTRANQLAQQFAIKREVRLQFQQQLLSPVTYGCLKPV